MWSVLRSCRDQARVVLVAAEPTRLSAWSRGATRGVAEPAVDEGSGTGASGSSFAGVLGRLVLAGVSAGLLYLSFAPRELWWLAPFAFAGLGLILWKRRARAGFGYGFVFGLLFNLAHLLWIEDFLGRDFGSVPWLALSAVLALFVGGACAVMTVVGRLPAGPVWMACLYLAQEAVRARWPFNGFPWGRVGFSQPEGAFTSLASIGGTPLVGFAVLVTGFSLAVLCVRPRRYVGPAVGVVLPVVAGLLVWPTVGTAATAGTRTIAVVQGNAPDIGLGLLNARDTLRRNHLAESARLLTAIQEGQVPQPDLVVWPETATALAGDDPVLDKMVRDIGSPALIGALYRSPEGRPENDVFAWDPRTGRGERYTKQELVPFGEYMPLRSIAGWFTPFVDATTDLRPGATPGLFNVADTRVGVAICYEVAYDYPLREAVEAGARLLVVPTNNAWYGPGEMTYQQLAMSRLRAVEFGRAVVVAATSGVSAIVRPDGSVDDSTGLYTADTLVETVPLRDTTTVALRVGAWPERLLVGAGLLTLLLAVSRGWRRSGATTCDAQGHAPNPS